MADTGAGSGVLESKDQGSQLQGQSSSNSSSVPLRSETDSSLPVVIALYDHEVCCAAAVLNFDIDIAEIIAAAAYVMLMPSYCLYSIEIIFIVRK